MTPFTTGTGALQHNVPRLTFDGLALTGVSTAATMAAATSNLERVSMFNCFFFLKRISSIVLLEIKSYDFFLTFKRDLFDCIIDEKSCNHEKKSCSCGVWLCWRWTIEFCPVCAAVHDSEIL